MIEFFAPWCPACKNFESTWKEFSGYSDELGIKVADVDITKDHSLSGRFLITALPSIFHCKDGQCRRYVQSRDLDALHSFVEDKGWENVEPLAWYRQPASVFMSAISCLFIFSANMQTFHEYLTGELGVHEYVSYGLYVVLTVIIGLLLGGVMVFISDFLAARQKQKLALQQKKDDPPAPTDENQENEEKPKENQTRRRVRKE